MDERGGVVVIWAVGEVDTDTSRQVRQAVALALESPVRHVVVQLDRVTFFGSQGPADLTWAAQRAADAGADIRFIVGDTRHVRRPLEIAGLTEVLPIV